MMKTDFFQWYDFFIYPNTPGNIQKSESTHYIGFYELLRAEKADPVCIERTAQSGQRAAEQESLHLHHRRRHAAVRRRRLVALHRLPGAPRRPLQHAPAQPQRPGQQREAEQSLRQRCRSAPATANAPTTRDAVARYSRYASTTTCSAAATRIRTTATAC